MGIVTCKGCDTDLIYFNINQYYFCSVCGTANYISDKDAENDNNRYFNTEVKSKPIEKRRKLFLRFERIHQYLYKNKIANFIRILGKINKEIISAKTCVEIGFGEGDELVKKLRLGANIYGFDLSSKMVSDFKKKYPEYSNRVFNQNAQSFDKNADIIYSNALFEHLDKPGDFLAQAHRLLSINGKLIIRLPLITNKNIRKKDYDINFWKPCHRVLYTFEGLNIILKKYGFLITEFSSSEYYGYKVMNRLLELGYKEIHRIRNPYFEIPGLNSEFIFIMILFAGLFKKVICSDSIFIAEKS
jgi:2-polyprenyl-3-methyl-5-hydroxy-6-metoxy-1,4-benzoquinol methylase